MTTTDTTQAHLEDGDIVKVTEAHNDLHPGELLTIEEVVRTTHPDNDSGEEFSIANGSRVMGATVLTSKVERIYTKDQYEKEGYPKWGSVIDQIKSALTGLDDATYVEVATNSQRLDPGEHSGATDLDLYFQRDDGHTVHATVRVVGRVLPLDEMD